MPGVNLNVDTDAGTASGGIDFHDGTSGEGELRRRAGSTPRARAARRGSAATSRTGNDWNVAGPTTTKGGTSIGGSASRRSGRVSAGQSAARRGATRPARGASATAGPRRLRQLEGQYGNLHFRCDEPDPRTRHEAGRPAADAPAPRASRSQACSGRRATARCSGSPRARSRTSTARRVGAASARPRAGRHARPATRAAARRALGATRRDAVHTDGEADALSRELGAKAFTSGRDIFFREGAFDPSTPEGFELLVHESTHVLQQAAGPVAGRRRRTARSRSRIPATRSSRPRRRRRGHSARREPGAAARCSAGRTSTTWSARPPSMPGPVPGMIDSSAARPATTRRMAISEWARCRSRRRTRKRARPSRATTSTRARRCSTRASTTAPGSETVPARVHRRRGEAGRRSAQASTTWSSTRSAS